ncbi:MAG: type VI secretion system-associated protein TagF [Pseudomonadota bacterium]
MTVVLYGKHPGFGDFLSSGLERSAVQTLEAWVQAVMPATRDLLGEAWEAAWAAAPDLRFWIGPDVLGVPLCGVWRASCDKVGRRYPLMLGLTGDVTPPPVHAAHDPAPYVTLADHLDTMADTTAGQGAGQGGVQGLIAGCDPAPVQGTPYDAGQAGMLWGMRGDDDLGRLFADAAEADAYCAQYARSHWWHEGTPGREAGWLSVNGLPDADALRWLLAERVRATEITEGAQAPGQEDAGRGQG